MEKLQNLKTVYKVLLGIITVAIIVVAVSGIAYTIAPRDFMQLILNDEAYVKYTLAQNLGSAYPMAEQVVNDINARETAYNTDGEMDISLDSSMFPSEEIATEVSKYLSSLSLNSNIYVDGDIVKVNGDLKDADGSVINADAYLGSDVAYVKIDQFGNEYMNILESANAENGDVDSGTTSEDTKKEYDFSFSKTYEAMVEKGVEDDFKEAIFKLFETAMGSFDDTLISVIPNKALEVGSTSASGDVLTVMMTTDDFKSCITNVMTQLAEDQDLYTKITPCFPTEMQVSYADYKTAMIELSKEWTKAIDESGITNVNLEFYVDKKNEVSALEISILSPDTSTGVKAVLKDDAGEGMSVICERDNEKIFSADLKKDSKEADSGKVAIMSATNAGPLNINATYTGFEFTDDTFKVNVKTDKFALPGQKELDKITVDFSISAVEEGIELSVKANIEKLANAAITLSGKEIEYAEFSLPSKDDIKAFDASTLKDKATNFILSDLPKNSESFKEVYSTIIDYTVSNMFGNVVGDMASSIFENSPDVIGNAISGILDDALSGEGSVGNFDIDSIFDIESSPFGDMFNFDFSFSTRSAA